MPVVHYPKAANQKLSDHFRSNEFDCPCHICKETIIDSDLVTKLEALRAAVGAPIHINSGYRCQAHQDELSSLGYDTAKGISQHTLGRAADVSSPPLTGNRLSVYASAGGFAAIGIASSWIHVDLRDEKERRWTYKS